MLEPDEGKFAWEFVKAALRDAAVPVSEEYAKLVVRTVARSAQSAPPTFRPLQSLEPAKPDGETLVGILTPGMWDYWEVPVIRALEWKLSWHGCRFSRRFHLESPTLFLREFKSLAGQEPAAILMVPPPKALVSNSIRRWVRGLGIPIVTLDREFGEYPCVEPDHQLGSAKMTDALLSDRPTAAVLVFGDPRFDSVAQRVKGFDEVISNDRYSRSNCQIMRVKLGHRPLPGAPFPGARELERAVRTLSKAESVGFVVDSPSRALTVFGTVEFLKGSWPRRWQLFHFDSLNEGDLLTYRSLGRGPQRVGGCEVNRLEIADEAVNLVLGALQKTNLTGKIVKVPPDLKFAS